MAELAKLLHFKKSGTEQTAKAYSTVDEAGDNYVNGKIDGVACYIPIGATDDAMATNGRVIKGGSTYAIKSQAKPPYAEVSYTTAGTYTFTVPAGITRLRVAVCGGGGGGNGAYYGTEVDTYQYAGNGGESSFDSLLKATGGGGGGLSYYYDSDNSIFYNSSVGVAGSPNGNSGKACASQSSQTFSGATGFALSFSKSSGTYGQGGSVTSSWSYLCCTGSSGGYNSNYITVSPNTTYTIKVGAGGSLKKGSNGGATNGNSGFVLIAYGGDI